MDLKHCPSSATLADFSFGNGFSTSEIVLRAHISACRHCRTKIREIETIGSDLLMNEIHDHLGTPLENIDSKVDEIVEGYDSSCDREGAKISNLSKSKADDFELDDSLDCLFPSYLDCSFDALPWKSAGKDIQLCKLREDGNSRLWMIKGKPGAKLPKHSHRGQELTLVLKGAYACSSNIYQPGDLHECDDENTHQPIIVGEVDCISLVATEGNLKFDNPFLRLIQPMLGI